MSLRSIHILFVTLSVVLAFLFGAWAMRAYSPAVGIVAFVAGVALAAYGVWFLRKTRGMGNR